MMNYKVLFVECICLLSAVFVNAGNRVGHIAVPSAFTFQSCVDESGDEDRREETLLVMFWNLENFFDWKDGGCSGSDSEFSSFGERHWTRSRFYTKCNVIAKTFLWIEDEYGRIPDVAGFAEVENRFVLNALLNATALRKYDYDVVHYDSPDPRGIDVALIYRRSVFRKSVSRPVKVSSRHIHSPDGQGSVRYEDFRTRDILYVALQSGESDVSGESDGGRMIHFLVNHHPSKYGGEEVSAPKRMAAMETMISVCDSIGLADIVCMGDFNDTPDSPLFDFSGRNLVNKSDSLYKRGEGTIRYKGKRDLIDMFIVSTGMSGNSVMEICKVPFLTVWDNAYPGEKPFRTYSGPRYIGGVSDHCPVLLRIFSEMP